MMKFRARGARIAFVLAFTILCSNPLTAQDSPIRGRFQVIWEDPEMHQEAGRMRFFVTDELNRANEILIPRSLASNIVDVLDLDGQYVRVEGRRVHDADAMTGMSVEADVLDPVPAPTGQLSVEGLSSIMTGERPWVTLLCRFAGSNSTPHARSWYEAIMGSSYPGMIDYWRESSFGQLDLVRGDVVGWYDLPQPRSAYMNGDVPDVNRLKDDCATAADDDVDFPAYFGVNFQFNESLGCCSFGGRGQLILDGQTKAYSMTWLPNWSDQRLYAHEMGHGFGLRHSSGPYGNTYDSNWDVMSRGRNHSDPNYGWVAPHTISYHKDGLGWFDAAKTFVASPGSSERIRLHRIGDPAASGEYHIAKIPLTSETFYTVEVRRSYGYDQNLPGDAVVLHHVDLSRGAYVVDPDNDGDPNDAGAMWLPGETFTDNAAGVTVRVESSIADGYEVTVALGGDLDPQPSITVSPQSLSYETTEGTNPSDKSFSVQNNGGGTLDYTVSSNRNWLDLSRSSGSLGAGDAQSVTVSVDASGLAVGAQNGTITVGGNGDNAPQTVSVTVVVSEQPSAPRIAVGPPSLSFQVKGKKPPEAKKLSIQNAGSQDLHWNASSSQPWLKLDKSSGTLSSGSTDSLSVEVSLTGLGPGTYDAAIEVAGNADNSPQSVAVQLKLTKGGVVKLKKGRQTFAGSAEEEPLAAYVLLENDGDADAEWSASADQEWVSLDAMSGNLAAGSSVALSLHVQIADLALGMHSARIEFAGGDDELPDTLQVELMVADGPGVRHPPEQAAAHLLGAGASLGSDELDYIDFVGNGNGRFDVGDLRAWLIQAGELPADAPLLSVDPRYASQPETTSEGLPAVSRESAERSD